MNAFLWSLATATAATGLGLYWLEEETWQYAAMTAGGFWAAAGLFAWDRQPLGTAATAVPAVIWTLIAWLDWTGRRGGRKRRLISALGHKGRAALAKLAQNMPAPARGGR